MLDAGRVHVQQATASDASVVIQVGGDLYLSDASLSAFWVPRETTPGECPYPGLDAFGPGQAQWFFGRKQVTGDVLAQLDDAVRTGSGGPVLVVGPSGAGKSSLLGAGLMTALARGRLAADGSATWPRVMFTPGAHPLDTLRGALATCEQAGGVGRAVIVVDQLEEIFTVCGEETERSEFLEELSGLAPAAVVLGLRADFYARATAYPVLRSAMQARQVVLGAMSAAEVRDAITLPARNAGLTLEHGLAERLLGDLGVDEDSGYEPGRLPLLAHALRATWQRRDGDRLTMDGYKATGGIGGAIAATAEGVYAGLDDAGRRAARRVFLSLVRVGEAASGTDAEGTADTRCRVSADSLYAQAPDEPATRAVVAAFTNARLLSSGEQVVQITHEALLGQWPRLKAWIGDDRAGNLVRQQLEEAAATWDREGRDASALYGGVRLAAAQAWARDSGRAAELSRVARDFLGACDRRRRRGVRRRNAIIAVLAALSLALGALTVFAFNQRATAQDNAQVAESAALASQSAVAYSDDNPGPAMQYAALGWRLHSSQQSLSALLGTQAVPYTGRLESDAATADGEMLGVAYSPDGTLIATAGSSGYVRLWSAASYRQLTSALAVATSFTFAVTFSPDGRTLAVGQPGGVSLWHVIYPAHLVSAGFIRTDGDSAQRHVNAVAFGSGGQTLAVADSAGSVQLWNLRSRTLEGRIATASAPVGLAFAAQGRLLAVATDRGAVELWDPLRRGVSIIQPANGQPGAVAVSPDGQTVAFAANKTAGTAPSIDLWSLATRQVTATLTGLGNYNIVTSVAFSPDGRLLGAGGIDGTVRLWDLRAARAPVLLGTFTGHRSPVVQVAFSPGGGTLASASWDGSVGLWDVRGDTLPGGANPAIAAAFSPDGRLLAVGVAEAGAVGVFLFSMPSRTFVAILPASRPVTAIAFSPGGRTLAAAENGPSLSTVQLWNVSSRRLAGQIQQSDQGGIIRGLAFSPDGRLLATSGVKDPVVRLWDTARLTQVAALDTDPDPDELGLPPGNWAVAFSPDGRLLAVAGGDGLTLLYSVATHTLVEIDDQQNTEALSVAFSPNGGTVAMGAKNGSVYLYPVAPPKRPPTLAAGPFTSATGFLEGSSQPIISITYTPDGGTLLAAGFDGTIRGWDVAAHAVAWSIATTAGAIWAMSYSAATDLAVTADGHVTRVWQTNPGQVADSICRTLRIPPWASENAWSTYLPGLRYTPACG